MVHLWLPLWNNLCTMTQPLHNDSIMIHLQLEIFFYLALNKSYGTPFTFSERSEEKFQNDCDKYKSINHSPKMVFLKISTRL